MSVILSPVVNSKHADWPDPARLTTAKDITEALRFYETLESQIDNDLDTLVSDHARIDSLLDDIDATLPTVATIELEARDLAVRIDNTAQVAERISGQVRQLDEEQSRVKESIDMAQSVQELKTAILAIASSMEKQDWESATRHMQRARAIDAAVLNSSFAEAVVVSSLTRAAS